MTQRQHRLAEAVRKRLRAVYTFAPKSPYRLPSDDTAQRANKRSWLWTVPAVRTTA